MTDQDLPYDKVEARRIGFVTDSHCHQEDGSDLPLEVLNALAGVDLIVHLGDMGKKGVLDRLGDVAPVLATRHMETDPREDGGRIAETARIIEASGVRIGAVWDIAAPGVDYDRENRRLLFQVQDGPTSLMTRSFGQQVEVVAFGAHYGQSAGEQNGVLFFNPGRLFIHEEQRPGGGMGSVAILDVSGAKPSVRFLEIERSA